MAAGRKTYDSDDDNLLIKYLARYNPGVQGRKGNKIYQTLVKNAEKKWSWASRHSWSGWRDHYCKHQDEFDRKIKKYQLRKGLPTENSTHINGTKKTVDSDIESDADERHKRKYIAATDARKRAKIIYEEEEEEEAAQAEQVEDELADRLEDVESLREASPIVPNIYPNLAALHDSRPKSIPRTTAVNGHFVSLPPTPSDTASRPPTTASNTSRKSSSESDDNYKMPKSRKLPQLSEGPFRTRAFGKTRRNILQESNSDEDDEIPWPPIRDSQKTVKKPSKSPFKLEPPAGQRRVDAKEPSIVTKPPNNTTSSPKKPEEPPVRLSLTKKPQRETEVKDIAEQPKRAVAHRAPQHVNAVASSSRVKLPVSSAFREPPPRSPPKPSQNGVVGRSPSPLDWGSPVGGLPSSPLAPPSRLKASLLPPPSTAVTPSRRPIQPPPATRSPFDINALLAADDAIPRTAAQPRRRHLQNVAQPRQPPQPLFFAGMRSSNTSRIGGSRSVISEEERGSTRRSRAPSPATDTSRPQLYQLASPPRASSVRQQPRSPLSSQPKRRSQFEQVFISRDKPSNPSNKHHTALQAESDATRRHSYPASTGIPRIDFDTKRIFMPRQSLPASVIPPHQQEFQQRRVSAPQPRPQQSRRHSSVFTFRAQPRPSSLPSSVQGSPTAAALHADVGVQTLLVMAENHGFSLQVVENVFTRTRSIAKTDAILLKLRETADAAVEAMLEVEDVDVEDEQREALVLRHKRQLSGASTTIRTPQYGGGAGSSNRKRHGRTKQEEEAFRPRPLGIDPQDVLADMDYTPPSGSRAAAVTRAARKSRESGADMSLRETHGSSRRAVPVEIGEILRGNMQGLRELERRDVDMAMQKVEEVARYVLDERRRR
ncbi:hypothetical protein C8F01DRAFT_1135555 [Mycena amicta]|nr:hypothetical protein C8F01DRAFT_1135555 [Mycena amicta]